MFAAVGMQWVYLQSSERVLFPKSAHVIDWNTSNLEEAQRAFFLLTLGSHSNLRNGSNSPERFKRLRKFYEMNVEPDNVIAIATQYIACYCITYFWKNNAELEIFPAGWRGEADRLPARPSQSNTSSTGRAPRGSAEPKEAFGVRLDGMGWFSFKFYFNLWTYRTTGGCIAMKCYALILNIKDFPLSYGVPLNTQNRLLWIQILSKKMIAWLWASFTSRPEHRGSVQKQCPRWNKSPHLPVNKACDRWLVL